MSTPSRIEIERKAREIKILDEVTAGLPVITAEREELSESGYLKKAQDQLMRGDPSIRMQQRKYLDELASELKLIVLSKREHRYLEKQAAWRDILKKRGLSIVKFRPDKMLVKKMAVPKIAISSTIVDPSRTRKLKRSAAAIIKPKKSKPRRKRKVDHGRTGVVPKALKKRIENGERIFLFSDDVWKVRKPRRR